MMKKQIAVALVLLLLMPIVLRLGGFVFSLINPEIAAGHPNYVRNYHFLNAVKIGSLWTAAAVIAILWLLVCLLVIRSKQRSLWWLLLAAFGPFGFAILAILRDKAPREADRHEHFVRRLNPILSVAYQASVFVIIWLLAFQLMVLKRNLMIQYESFTTGVSTAQIIDLQNASSGMWAFAEGNEVMYLVVVLYLVWPVVFNLVARAVTGLASPKTS